MKLTAFAAALLAAATTVAGCGTSRGAEAVGASTDGSAMAQAAAGRPLAAQLPPYAGSNVGAVRGITVFGTGTAKSVPDVADWSFGVNADGGSASATLASAGASTRRIVAALRAAGIAKHDLRTEQVSLYPRTTGDGRTVIGYTASSSVHATVRSIRRAGAVVDAAVKAGASEFSGPGLRVSDTRAQYRSAFSAALDDARARAEAIAADAGLTLGDPIAISEAGGGGSPLPVYDGVRETGMQSSVSIEPGIDEMSATLSVTFAIS